MKATTLVVFALASILLASAKPLPQGRDASNENAVIQLLLRKLSLQADGSDIDWPDQVDLPSFEKPGQVQQDEGAPKKDEEMINEENGVASRPNVIGDIVLSPEQLEELEKYNRGEGSAQGFFLFNQAWPGGIFPYTIAPDITPVTQILIKSAMDEIEANTCIKFVRLDFSNYLQYPNYVEFFVGQGCYSALGMEGKGRQLISIGLGCEHKVIIQHEILHALGRIHEQSRPDRDNYVHVIIDNVVQGMENNFDIIPSDTQNIGYDYGSVMHYPRGDFSIRPGDPNFYTVIPKQIGVEIGQRRGLSQSDWLHINTRYCGASPGPVFPGPGPVFPGPGPVFPGPGPVPLPGPGPVFPGPGPVFPGPVPLPGPGPVFPGPGPVPVPGPGPVFPGPGPVFPGPGPVPLPGPGPVFPGPGPVFPGPVPLPGPGPVFPGPGPVFPGPVPLPGPGPVFPGPGPLPGPGPVFPGPGPVFPWANAKVQDE